MGIILQPPQPHDSLRGDSRCGTLIEYGGRGHTFILGTASIDNKGRGVHHGIFESSSTIRKISTCETIYVIIQWVHFFMWTHFLLLLSGKLFQCLDIVAINDEPAPRLIDEAWKAVQNRSVLNQGRSPRRHNDGQQSGRLYFDSTIINTSYCLPISRWMCYYAH